MEHDLTLRYTVGGSKKPSLQINSKDLGLASIASNDRQSISDRPTRLWFTLLIAAVCAVAVAPRRSGAQSAAGAKPGPVSQQTPNRAGRDWWALQPVVRPALPPVHDPDWPAGELDRFVLAKLEAADLKPSPQAGRTALIRRVSFDLTGLPPTPEQVAVFSSDDSPDAYARLVDRLLQSPHYGERWARHWLDVIRFGESQGFERDKLRPDAWRYRDWVVWAMNRDVAYDEFLRLQLAGDVLGPDDPLAVVATGFLVAGAYDEVGQSQQSAAMKAVVREDEMEDIVGTVGQTILGLTVHCGRCHDHKFDPIDQIDYYQLSAALGGVRHGSRESLSEAGRAEAARRSEQLAEQIARLRQELEAIEGPVRERLLAARKADEKPAALPMPIARWEFDDEQDSLGELGGTLHGAARIEQGRLLVDGKDSYLATEPLKRDVAAKTLEAWVRLADVSQRGGGLMSIQTLDGEVFDAIVFGEREPGQWMAGSNDFARTQSFAGQPESEAGELVHVAIVYETGGTIRGYRNGRPYGKPYTAPALQGFTAGKWQVLFGLRHGAAGGNRMLAGSIERAQLYDRVLSPAEVAASAGVEAGAAIEAILAELSVEQRRRRDALVLATSQLELEQRLLCGGSTYAVVPREPGPVHVLRRGDPKQPGAVVAPGGLDCIGALPGDFGLSLDAPEAQRRVKLAEWMTDARNPLTARVIVNRVWHYHFGAGLVTTPNDFGLNGGRPSHPKLLDWLASELVHNGWSLKQLHRTILLSATYRQASRSRPEAVVVDRDNGLLWRFSPRRLEAEEVRDAVLAVAGELNPTMGGPGYRDFRTFTNNTQFYEAIDPAGYAFNRRSIYRTWVRSGTNPLLDLFDCPDPSTTAPRRAVTTTPLQALALLNNSLLLRNAERFARRVRREAGSDAADQVRYAQALAFAREPDGHDAALGRAFVEQHGLVAYCRLLFNANEFLYVD